MSKVLKRFRVTYSDFRTYFYDVDAIEEDEATAIAEQRCGNGDEGTTHDNGGLYAVHETTEEVHS